MTNKIIGAIAVLALILSGFTTYRLLPSKTGQTLGTAGGLLIENYIPAILYNDGYKSEKEIVLSGANGDITTGDDLTVADDLTVTTTNTATSTSSFGCIQTTATSTASPIKLVFTSSFTSTTTYPSGTITGANGGLVAWSYGSCP